MGKKEFMRDFQSHIAANDWLSFGMPFNKIKIECFETGGPEIYELRVNEKTKSESFIRLQPLFNDCRVLTAGICSGKKGCGKELLRRSVYFFYEKGFNEIRTGGMALEGACTFWFSYGFRPTHRIEPEWFIVSRYREDEVSFWRERLKNDADALWELANTEIGQQAFSETDAYCVLNLADEKQRKFAFHRLNLPVCSKT